MVRGAGVEPAWHQPLMLAALPDLRTRAWHHGWDSNPGLRFWRPSSLPLDDRDATWWDVMESNHPQSPETGTGATARCLCRSANVPWFKLSKIMAEGERIERSRPRGSSGLADRSGYQLPSPSAPIAMNDN